MNTSQLFRSLPGLLGFACMTLAALTDVSVAKAATITTHDVHCFCDAVVLSDGSTDYCCWCEAEGLDPETACTFN